MVLNINVKSLLHTQELQLKKNKGKVWSVHFFLFFFTVITCDHNLVIG